MQAARLGSGSLLARCRRSLSILADIQQHKKPTDQAKRDGDKNEYFPAPERLFGRFCGFCGGLPAVNLRLEGQFYSFLRLWLHHRRGKRVLHRIAGSGGCLGADGWRLHYCALRRCDWDITAYADPGLCQAQRHSKIVHAGKTRLAMNLHGFGDSSAHCGRNLRVDLVYRGGRRHVP